MRGSTLGSAVYERGRHGTRASARWILAHLTSGAVIALLVSGCFFGQQNARAASTIYLRPVQHQALDIRLGNGGITYRGGALVLNLLLVNRGPGTYHYNASRVSLSAFTTRGISLSPVPPEEASPPRAVLAPGMVTPVALAWTTALQRSGLDVVVAIRDAALNVHFNAFSDASGRPLPEQFPLLSISQTPSRNVAIARVPRMQTQEVRRSFRHTDGSRETACPFEYVTDPPVAGTRAVCPADRPHLAALLGSEEVADLCMRLAPEQPGHSDCAPGGTFRRPNSERYIGMICCRSRTRTTPEYLR